MHLLILGGTEGAVVVSRGFPGVIGIDNGLITGGIYGYSSGWVGGGGP